MTRLSGLLVLLAAPMWLLVVLMRVALALGAPSSFSEAYGMGVAFLLLLLVVPAVATYRLSREDDAAWAGILMLLGVIGMVLGASAEVLLVTDLVQYEAFLFLAIMSGGMLLMWMLGVAYLGFFHPHMPAAVGWLALGVFAISGATTLAARLGATVAFEVCALFLVAAVTFALLEFGFGLLNYGRVENFR